MIIRASPAAVIGECMSLGWNETEDNQLCPRFPVQLIKERVRKLKDFLEGRRHGQPRGLGSRVQE